MDEVKQALPSMQFSERDPASVGGAGEGAGDWGEKWSKGKGESRQ